MPCQFASILSRAFAARPRLSTLVLAALASVGNVAVYGHGGLHDTIAKLSTELALRPRDPALHHTLAAVYCEHGEWQNALAHLALAERLGTVPANADLIRGQALLQGKQPTEALVALDRFLAANPQEMVGLLERGRALAQLGRVEAAIAAYADARAITGQTAAALFLENAELLQKGGRLAEAADVLAEGIRRQGPAPALLLKALEQETALGRYDDALSRLPELERTAPRPEPWQARRAELLAKAGRPEEAQAAWQALQARLAALPNLERGTPELSALSRQAERALGGQPSPTPENNPSLSRP